MYGCGTEGITAEATRHLTCTKSIIKECTYSIMTLDRCSDIIFKSCNFFDNKEYALVTVRHPSTGVSFEGCSFYRNQGTLFILESRITLNKCSIDHPIGDMGSSDMIDWVK